MIACCLCGSHIIPNEAAMCLKCLQLQVGKENVLDDECEVIQCKKCERWHVRQDQWINHDLESAGLLGLCLKKINGLSKLKVIDALWIWTEPHSKRLKVAITIERPILNDKMNVKQKIIVEFIVKNKQCMECIREATDHSWVALIQLRQRIPHKRSLYALEDLLTKANMHTIITGVEVVREGIDLYFKSKGNSDRVLNVIAANLPIRTKHSKKLISTDTHSNTQRYEYTAVVEVPPISKDDLVVIPRESGRAATLMIVSKVSSSIHLIDPTNMNIMELTSSKYFSKPFFPVFRAVQAVPFLVLDVEPVETTKTQSRHRNKKEAKNLEFSSDGKSVSELSKDGARLSGLLAEIEVMRESEEGMSSEQTVRVLSHLGHILRPGDTVLGYDILHAVVDEQIKTLSTDPPDVVLIRKANPDKTHKNNVSRRRRKATWIPDGDLDTNSEGASMETEDDVDEEDEGDYDVVGNEVTDEGFQDGKELSEVGSEEAEDDSMKSLEKSSEVTGIEGECWEDSKESDNASKGAVFGLRPPVPP